jgi:hypothetical protein
MTRRSAVEIAAVVLTAGLHFVFYDLLPGRGAFIGIAVLGWGSYVVARVVRHPGVLRAYGLGGDGLRPTVLAAGVILVSGLIVCAVIGRSRGLFGFEAHMIPVALLYPIWGIVQQVLVQSMFVRNLEPQLPRVVVVLLAGILFGLVHLPHVALAAATAILGTLLTVVFLRLHNVWPLGVCHGWLGVLFYFWVLGRDPWLEILGRS